MKKIGLGRLHKWLIDNNFPKGFQTLCFNCNCGFKRKGFTKEEVQNIKNEKQKRD